MCPMPGDDVTSAVTAGPRPAHHSGPGYVANPKAPDFELGEPLRGVAARWLNLVPAEHRHEGPESAKDALETLREHARSCPDHPLRALWVAHRHLNDPVPAVRIAALVLASEALWWLGHFEDARSAAQAAADADPASAQALWRLAVALYRLGRFEEAGEHLDGLLEVDSRFAPGLGAARPGQGLARPGQPEGGAGRLRRRGGAGLRFWYLGGAAPDDRRRVQGGG